MTATHHPFSVLAALLDLPQQDTRKIDLNIDIPPPESFEEWIAAQDNTPDSGSIFDEWHGNASSPEMIAISKEEHDTQQGYESAFRTDEGVARYILRNVRMSNKAK